jgi:hypothetical protein
MQEKRVIDNLMGLTKKVAGKNRVELAHRYILKKNQKT